jgi:hypothetical protein
MPAYYLPVYGSIFPTREQPLVSAIADVDFSDQMDCAKRDFELKSTVRYIQSNI